MSEHTSFSKALTLTPLPKVHSEFEAWEYEARSLVMASSPYMFDPELLFKQIDKDAVNPWVYMPTGTDEDKEKRQSAYKKLNSQLWSALLVSMKATFRHERDGSATLCWKLFYDKVFRDTKSEELEDILGALEGDEQAPVMRAVQPEFNGQFLWCKMRSHVMTTSRSSRHAAKIAFQQIRLQGRKVMEFLANVEEVAEQAGCDEDDCFIVVRGQLEAHYEFKQVFTSWLLNNPDSTDLKALKRYFADLEANKYNRFKKVPTSSGSRYGASATEWSGYQEAYAGDQSASDWESPYAYGGYAAAAQENTGSDDDLDEDPGPPWGDGDVFWDATVGAEESWQNWSYETPPAQFALAARFFRRKGKSGKKGFRRLMPKGRGKKGKSAGKGKWSPYGAKGKGVAAPSEEEDYDPFAMYYPESAIPLDHFYWDTEYGMCVYDPDSTTPGAVAQMQSRKAKGGGKKGKGRKKGQGNSSKGGKKGDKQVCFKWSEYRCTHGKECIFSHDGPGGFAPAKGKGAAAEASGQPGVAQPSGQLQQWQTSSGQPGVVMPSGQLQQWSHTPGVAQPSGQLQQWQTPSGQDGSATQAMVPYIASAAAQRQNLLHNVAPEDRVAVERYLLHQSRSQRPAAAVVPHSSAGPSGFPQ